ncbi:uncharacterized protein LOC108221372 [Daucus carota subsp. sativus]|uniref:uncharacterized protein LOC108221372 n=1 Tax=Daucus carota subsp. sativus TaxID=79200 RepID=UPI00308290F9
MNANPICSWCHRHAETPLHVLFTCSFAQELWDRVGMQEVLGVEDTTTVLQVFQQMFNSSSRSKKVMLGLFCWSLWWRRNSWVWDRKIVSAFGVQSMALGLLQEWQSSQEELGGGGRNRASSANRQWCKPPEGWIKVNIDAACHAQQGYIGIGSVARDENGQFLRASGRRIQGRWKPREAEALGLKEALLWVREWRTSKCVFEMDAKTVVDAIYGDGGNSYFHTIIEDCVDILHHFHEVVVVFERRSANKVAHVLAQTAYSMTDHMEWIDIAPDFICNLLSDDV